jgi:hypothetical protein
MTRSPSPGRSHVGYHNWRCLDGSIYGSFEVFSCADRKGGKHRWYWWACFPGCLPDGDPIGPFDTARLAYEDAMDGGAS